MGNFGGARMEELIKEADFLNDGRISYDEFIMFFNPILDAGKCPTVSEADLAIARAREFSGMRDGEHSPRGPRYVKKPKARGKLFGSTAALCQCVCSPSNRSRGSREVVAAE